MAPVQDFINQVIGQVRMVWSVLVPFLSAVAVCGLLIWGAMDWRYSGIIANRDSEVSSLKTQLAQYQRLGGAPDDVRKRIDKLEERILGRFLTDEAKAKFVTVLKRADAIKSTITIIITCEECLDFGEQIKAAANDAGWSAELVMLIGYAPLRGLKLSWTPIGPRKPVTIAFGDALAAAGLQFETINDPTFNQPALFVGRRFTRPK
jgi:hypothetical protein